MVYFAGLRFHGVHGSVKALQIPKPKGAREEFAVLLSISDCGGIDSPEFRASLVAAYRYIGSEETAKRYEDYQPLYPRKVLPSGEMAVVLG